MELSFFCMVGVVHPIVLVDTYEEPDVIFLVPAQPAGGDRRVLSNEREREAFA